MLRNVRSWASKALFTHISHSGLGDPVDDLAVATVLMVVGGQLVLLRPRKVRYDETSTSKLLTSPSSLVPRR